MKPILFDFNGTLFFDADINYYAWKQTIDELDTINFTSIDIKETDEDDPFLNNIKIYLLIHI